MFFKNKHPKVIASALGMKLSRIVDARFLQASQGDIPLAACLPTPMNTCKHIARVIR